MQEAIIIHGLTNHQSPSSHIFTEGLLFIRIKILCCTERRSQCMYIVQGNYLIVKDEEKL